MDSIEVCWKFEIFPLKALVLAMRKKIREERRGTFDPRTDSFLLHVEPQFCLPHEGEGKHTEPYACWCDVFYDNGVTQL